MMIRECTKCELHKTRTQVVVGNGNKNNKIVFIGEAPGADEDINGIPFCGRAGKVLDATLASIGLYRNEVYVTNCVKCRPPNNRDPLVVEKVKCSSWLDEELYEIQPKIVVTLGRHAFDSLSNMYEILLIDGIIFDLKSRYNETAKLFKVLHPAATLYNPNTKQNFIDQLKLVFEYYNKLGIQNETKFF